MMIVSISNAIRLICGRPLGFATGIRQAVIQVQLGHSQSGTI